MEGVKYTGFTSSLPANPLTEAPLAEPTQMPVGRKSGRYILQEKDGERI